MAALGREPSKHGSASRPVKPRRGSWRERCATMSATSPTTQPLVHYFVSSTDLGELGQDGIGLDVLLRGRDPEVVAPHVAAQGRPQRGHVVEGAAVHHLALQGAEPGLDPVQPGGVGGDEVEVEAGMGLLPGTDLVVPVGRVVVQDQCWVGKRRVSWRRKARNS